MRETHMSRRSFIAGAAGLGTALCLGAVGCSAPSSREQTAEDGSNRQESETSVTYEAKSTVAAGAYDPHFDLDAGTVLLNNGVTMPILGLGTYLLSSAQAETSVTAALDAGMRLIDTACIYGNEDGVGRAIAKSSVPRDQIFLTTKMWTADFSNGPAAIDGSLQKLGRDYVDLMLLHHEAANDEAAYCAMEDAAQAVIRWQLQSGNICIPGSSNPEHIREDANVFDFSLTPDEMAAIDAFDDNRRFASY